MLLGAMVYKISTGLDSIIPPGDPQTTQSLEPNIYHGNLETYTRAGAHVRPEFILGHRPHL